jgi:hypothetical protein
VGAAGGFYLWGKITHDDHKRETGLLSGEALINSFALSTAIKFAAGRERPLQDSGRGRFGQGGRSFPSEHAAAAWSAASVIAHEYPGPLTKLLAYGLASAVSASRVTSKEHFPSDVMVGSAIGWFIGRQVYRAHHDPELGGDSWDTSSDTFRGEPDRKLENMGSPYVSLDSWVYPALERLAALGYVTTAMSGMKPWTRTECARLTEEAGEAIRQQTWDDRPPEELAAKLFEGLEREFSHELDALGGGPTRQVQLESVYVRAMSISGPPLIDGYHFGQTIVNDYGRPFGEGANVVTGFSARATAGAFAVYVRGEYQHAPSSAALPEAARQVIGRVDFLPNMPPALPLPSVDRFRLLDAYVAMNLKNWQVSFGKQSLWWGPGQGGPMLFSDNAEPINMLRFNRILPFKLPSILGWLGPMRTEFFIGQLAGHRFINGPGGVTGDFADTFSPQPFIHGQKLSFKPTPNFEFSVSRTTLFAGSGVPFTTHTFLKSLYGAGNAPPGSRSDPGDRRSAVDFTYRIPKLRDWLTFYADAFADDQFSPLGYWDRSAIRAGIYMPRLPRLPRLDFRAEGVYTDLPIGGALDKGFFYFNSRYLNGYTNQGNLLGSWIGRQGQGAQIWTTYSFSSRNSLQLNLRHQKVSNEFIQGGGTLNDVGMRADLLIRPELGLSTFVQYERWAFPVLSSSSKSNVTASFQFTFWPRLRSK